MQQLFDIDTLNSAYVHILQRQSLKLFGVGQNEIEIHGNKATLTGRVRSWSEKNDAENATWKAQGITSIENKLIVDSEVYSYQFD